MDYKKHEPRLVDCFDDIDRTDVVDEFILQLSQETIEKIDSWELALNYHHKYNNDVVGNSIDVVIGFDFGTSCSKIIVQFPYEGEGGKTFAFPVPPEFRADEHPHCWKTMLFLEHGCGSMSLLPFDNASPVSDIKIFAMQEFYFPGKYNPQGELLQPVPITTAYIGLLLKSIKGWILCDIFPHINVDSSKRKIIWEFNLGLPEAIKINEIILKRFVQIANGSWHVANNLQPLHFNILMPILNSQEQLDDNIVINIRSEVVAQTIGFFKSEFSDFGFYAVVDIGASTFDVCTFNYVDEDGNDKFNILFAEIKLLGVRAINWIHKVNTEFNQSFTLDDLNSDIQSCIGNTLLTTKTHKAPNDEIWSKTLPIFLCGGGKLSKIHRISLEQFKTKYTSQSNVNATVEFVDVPIPENLILDCDFVDYHRLSVAWGLSIPDIEFNKFTMPSDIEDVPKLHKIDIGDRFTGPEQM